MRRAQRSAACRGGFAVSFKSDDQFLLPGQVAARLRVSPKTVSRWAAMGLVPYVVTLGGHRRFRLEDIEALARRMEESAVQSP